MIYPTWKKYMFTFFYHMLFISYSNEMFKRIRKISRKVFSKSYNDAVVRLLRRMKERKFGENVLAVCVWGITWYFVSLVVSCYQNMLNLFDALSTFFCFQRINHFWDVSKMFKKCNTKTAYFVLVISLILCSVFKSGTF